MLSFSIKSSTHLLSIEIKLPSEGITAVFGPTGAGKSTFFKIIAGLVPSESARIIVNDLIWQDKSSFIPIEKRRVALVKQRPYLFPHMNVDSNLRYPIKRRDSLISLEALIRAFDLSLLLDKSPSMLSGGELQRVAIVQAVLSNPSLLLLDEAFSAMDAKQKKRSIQALKQYLSLHECPVLMITHSKREIAWMAERVLMLSSGQVERVIHTPSFLSSYEETVVF